MRRGDEKTVIVLAMQAEMDAGGPGTGRRGKGTGRQRPVRRAKGRQPCCGAPKPDHYATCDEIPMPAGGDA